MQCKTSKGELPSGIERKQLVELSQWLGLPVMLAWREGRKLKIVEVFDAMETA